MLSAKPLGIIDTLGEGFASVHRYLWVLLLPILLDVLFAFGPGVSVAPVVQRVAQDAGRVMVTEGNGAGSDEESAQVVTRVQQALDEYGSINLLGLLAWQLPSLANATSPVGLPKLAGPVFTEVSSGAVMMGYGLALGFLGLAGTSLYLAGIAQAVRRELASVGLALRTGRVLLRLLTLWGLGVVVGIPVLVVSALVVGISSFAGSALVSMMGSLLLAVTLLLAFYTFFLDDGIAVADLWPVPAAFVSARVIARHFWTALGFIAVITLINTGMPLAWRWIIDNPAGRLVAIVGHAYISSGLAAAAMLFFWQRLQAQQTAVAGGTPSLRREA